MNISSVVVRVQSGDIDKVLETLRSADFCDYHFHDKSLGKIIVTIDGQGVSEEIAKIKKIQEVPCVISADLMMAYSEDELEKERDHIEMKGPVPPMLNDDTLRAEDIVYQGDLRKKNI
ncbi:MAG: chaperone NapD [Deltaproteobacteria bacterium]|nr:chaperone NapD [Deltaproteobacteria bacterium]